MIIQRLFGKTWTNLKTPEKRKEKAEELLRIRKEMNATREKLLKKRDDGIKLSGKGDNYEPIKDGSDKITGSRRITVADVKKRYREGMDELNAWSDHVQDTTHRTPKPKPKPVEPVKEVEKGIIEKGVESGKKFIKNPKTKKWGLIGVGALGGTLAIEGIDAGVKKMKDKKREKESKEQILQGKKK